MRAKSTTASAPRHARRVYSYERISTKHQTAGSGIERQASYAAKWAKDHGLVLDASLSMRDEGLSAYHQKHVKKGALGLFLRAIEEGQVPSGSVLIVENFDRLSRASALDAQAQLSQIVNAGITVVTASDGREYNAESLKRDPMSLIYSVLEMIRAHEESARKSGLSRGAIRKKCTDWINGTSSGRIGGLQSEPKWVTWDEGAQRFVFDEQHAHAMRRMIHYYKAGYGAIRVTRMLAEEGLAISEKYPVARIRQIISSPAIMGTKTVTVGADAKFPETTYALPGYYPALLSAEEFEDLQHLVSKRGTRKGKGEWPSVVTGLRLSFCGYCGARMIGQNTLRKNKADEQSTGNGYRRLWCASYLKGSSGCRGGRSCSIVPVEHALMTYCSVQKNLDRLLESDHQADPLAAKLAAARKRLAGTETKLAEIQKALTADGGEAPDVYLSSARELEADRRDQQMQVEKLERELGVQTRATPSTAKVWAKLVEGVKTLDYDTRMQARRLVSETFERIDIVMKGLHGDQPDVIRLRLTSRRGNVQELDIDRQTGERIEGDEITVENLKAAGKPARKPRKMPAAA